MWLAGGVLHPTKASVAKRKVKAWKKVDMADIGALFCMGVVFLLIIYCLLEIAFGQFDDFGQRHSGKNDIIVGQVTDQLA